MSERGTWSRGVEAKLDAAGLTGPGKDWLLMSLDPFPDKEHTICGMPDGAAGRSIVQQYNQTLTITKPPGLAAGALWDCHVAFIPDLLDPVSAAAPDTVDRSFTGVMVLDDGSQIGETANPFPWRAPLAIVSVPTGVKSFPVVQTDIFDPATMRIDGFDMTGYLGPQSRVIGGGFEVENTTAELTVSGGVSYYTVPTENVKVDTAYTGRNAGTNFPSIRTLTSSRTPPPTVAACMSVPGSIRRKAKDGAYIPLRQSKGQSNPPIDPQRSSRVFMSSAPYATAITQPVAGFGTTTNNWITIAALQPVPELSYAQPIPFDNSGAYFSGLSDTTSLDVTLRLFIEVFPTTSTQVLVSTTNPAPPEDPVAIELYSRVARDLPPGVEVKYNANGGWFQGLMKTIGSIAPTIGSALGTVIPGAGLIGKGVGTAAELLAGMKLGEKAQKEVDDRRSSIGKRLQTRELYEEPEQVRASTSMETNPGGMKRRGPKSSKKPKKLLRARSRAANVLAAMRSGKRA